MKIYISGPISNDKDASIKFKAAEEYLRSKGYDPVNPEYMEQPNPFYYPIQYLDNKYKQHIKPINKDKFDWILEINEFDAEIYYSNNLDLQRYMVKEDYVSLLFHFITKGQYEMGRCVGFY